jgi:hypothetical protein
MFYVSKTLHLTIRIWYVDIVTYVRRIVTYLIRNFIPMYIHILVVVANTVFMCNYLYIERIPFFLFLLQYVYGLECLNCECIQVVHFTKWPFIYVCVTYFFSVTFVPLQYNKSTFWYVSKMPTSAHVGIFDTFMNVIMTYQLIYSMSSWMYQIWQHVPRLMALSMRFFVRRPHSFGMCWCGCFPVQCSCIGYVVWKVMPTLDKLCRGIMAEYLTTDVCL